MRIYYPNAMTDDLEHLTTTEGFLTVGDASYQFGIWREDYGFILNKMWVQEFDDGIWVRDIRVRDLDDEIDNEDEEGEE